ncbi:uncharacterized protein Tco025E_01592 [Trypanosoma conorhini]|uniref:Uncharacterized protein n=1 Tax=Trypanosoma conorhini TaxID=83891 RepID=A0A3R7LFB0_9TRYP|nr:uncharacterized protein Tco025E_01592 [Trypanosoma conorhini]RNF26147.1 hypothetical protein Tco025E_01592 [Trypanosoma conorhini]
MNTSSKVSDLVVATPSPSAAERSYATMAGTTLASRNRALVVQHRKETAKATVREVDVVHRGLKRLETRMHELESRVQYVNPWVVQYMWEMLCELRDKIGVKYSQQREKAWMTELQQHGPRSRGDQPLTEPRARASPKRGSTETATAADMRTTTSLDGMLLTTPMRLFEDSNEAGGGGGGGVSHDDGGDNLETSVSSESDEETAWSRENGLMASEICAQGGASLVRGPSGSDDARGVKGGRLPGKNGRWLARYLAAVEARWEGCRVAQEERSGRMEVALEESTQRSFLLASLSRGLATALHQKELALASSASSTRGTDYGVQRAAAQRRRRRLDDLDVPSPPRPELPAGLSPIAPTQSPSDFFSPQQGDGRRGGTQERKRPAERCMRDVVDEDSDFSSPNGRGQSGRGEREVAMVASSVLKAPGFLRQLVEEVSRQLAVQIQQADMTGAANMPPTESLPSALLLTVREAVNAIAGAHDEALYHQIHESLAEEQRRRASKEERLWQRVADQEGQWTRLAATERQAEAELLQEHQRLIAVGKEDAEACGEIRRELLKLCGEVVRAVERVPDTFVAPLPTTEIVDRAAEGSGAVRNDRVELRLETLSAAVNGLYSDVESLRKRSQGELAPQAEWCKLTERRITTLQESMVDVQEAVAIVARKSRDADERLDAAKAEKKELTTWEERLQGLEQQMEALPSILTTAPPPPPLPPPFDTETTTEMNLMSVEDAMMCVQKLIVSRGANTAAATDPYVKAVTALCATLQQLSHLYNIGTGTFGGSLRLIFAMPPLSVPSSVAGACETYLREHSAAELKEAVEALNLTHQVARVLCDCYYWMQSHLLVVRSGVTGETPQQLETNTGPGEGQAQEGAESSSRSVAVASLPKTQSPSVVSDAKRGMEVLPRPQAAFFAQEMAHASSYSTATQTEPLKTARPSTLSQVRAGAETNSEAAEETPRRECQTVDLAAPTALEALATAVSPATGDAHCGVVHHFHYHHSCGQEPGHLRTPPRPGEDEKQWGASSQPQASHRFELRSDAEDGWDAHETRLGASARRGEPSYRAVSYPAEQVAPAAVPPLNRSHIDAGKRIDLMEARTVANGYTSVELPPTPSAVNECLPLPTAASCFIDPQQATQAARDGGFSLKNPQPFYTAVTRPRRHSQCSINKNNSDGSARARGAPFAPHLAGDEHPNGMRRALRCHPTVHPSVARGRDDVLTSVVSSHLRQNPCADRGDKSSRRERSAQR